MKRLLATLLAAALLMGMAACPAALAAGTANACTPMASAGEGTRNNMIKAAEAINGTRLAKGEIFSFNETVGPRTKAQGYVTGKNGRGAKVTGGGVAQAAATLYLALLDLPDSVRFEEVSTYGSRYTGDYVDDGELAVITDYSAGTDFSFTNLASDMLIEMWSNGSYLCCSVTVDGGVAQAAAATDTQAASGSGWFDVWETPAPSTMPDLRQTVASARIPMGSDESVIHNVRLAAGSVNDTTLAQGDAFSFNRVVGPRTGEFGFIEATNGRGAKVVGGGVAQVASALWLAVKDMDDVAVLEKSTYGKRYNQRYVSSSADAILTDYNAGTDFSFRYTGQGTVTLYAYIDGNDLCCDVVRNG